MVLDFSMWYVPRSSSCSCLPLQSSILNLSHETADLTNHFSAVLALKLISRPLLAFISVLRVVIVKILVKPAVYSCTVAHSTNWSKNHRMPEVMAKKRKSQENHKTLGSGDSCGDKYSSFLMRKLSYLFFFFLNNHLHIDIIESVIYNTCHKLLCDGNKINSCYPLRSNVLNIQI